MNDSEDTHKRLLVVLNDLQDYQAILEIAVSFAVRNKVELLALFVEDVNLIHLSGLPFAREIDRMSSSEQQIDTIKVTRALENKVQQIRQFLREIYAQSSLKFSLKVVRGHYFAEAISAADEVELLLLNQQGNRHLRTVHRKHVKQKILPVWVVYDAFPGSERCLMIAEELLENNQAELNIVLRVQAEEEIPQIKQQVLQRIDAAQLQPHFFIALKNDFASIRQYLLLRGCSIIVMRKEISGEIEQTIALFADLTDCPVLLVA